MTGQVIKAVDGGVIREAELDNNREIAEGYYKSLKMKVCTKSLIRY